MDTSSLSQDPSPVFTGYKYPLDYFAKSDGDIIKVCGESVYATIKGQPASWSIKDDKILCTHCGKQAFRLKYMRIACDCGQFYMKQIASVKRRKNRRGARI